jgi:predicted phosphodiesterase
MTYGFVTDVHGSRAALLRALESLSNVDHRYFLGDLAGGREVRECLKLLQDSQIPCVPGNHDTWDFELVGLSPESIAAIQEWPIQREESDFVAVHSDCELVNGAVRYPYIYSASDAQRALACFSQRLVFYGHTHVSQIFELDREGKLHFYEATPERSSFSLEPQSRYLVNVGAAPDCTAVYDDEQQQLRYQFFGPLASLEPPSTTSPAARPEAGPAPPGPAHPTSLWERLRASFRR